MSEVSLFRLIKGSDFDGNTWITLTRDNFTVSGQRSYVATVNGPGGSIGGDFFGVFSRDSAKVVGVAGSLDFTPRRSLTGAQLIAVGVRRC